MLKTGEQHLDSLRDGRKVYIGDELVEDVTTHPAFRNAAQSFAMLYDRKRDADNIDVMAYEDDDGELSTSWYLKPASRDDLRKRRETHRRVAEWTCGLIGRSPDHVASFVTGLLWKPQLFEENLKNSAGALQDYYDYMRKNDTFACYTVLPPQGARQPERCQREGLTVPTLRVTAEDKEGITLNGMKMLGTSAVFSNETWVGNLLPLGEEQAAESVTCAVPLNWKGVTIWTRKPFERFAVSEFDAPFAWKFDETDSMVIFEDVKVPWERVFTHNNAALSREIYFQTPSHAMGNHQSNIRFWAKLQLMTGVLSKITASSGNNQIPAVVDQLGRMAALEATLGGMIHGQIEAFEGWPGGDDGYVTINRRYMYAALNWCTENHSMLIEMLRELMGGGVFQMPADVSVMSDPDLRQKFEQFWSTPFMESLDRMKLYRLAWDLVGSEFAGRHTSYEKFYAGSYFVVRNHSFREAPWDDFHAIAERQLDAMDVPEE